VVVKTNGGTAESVVQRICVNGGQNIHLLRIKKQRIFADPMLASINDGGSLNNDPVRFVGKLIAKCTTTTTLSHLKSSGFVGHII
jgi:hypothetical protein